MNKKELFLEKVKEGLHYDELAELFEVTKKTIKNWADEEGVKVKLRSNRKNFFDFDFFNDINTEGKAYILGFIAADGYVSTGGKCLCITLSKKDRVMLEMIAGEMSFTGSIREEKRDRITLNLCSKDMVRTLSKYGIVQNKTKTVSIPDIPNDLKRHFLRGYFDGDGYIGERSVTLITSSDQFERDLDKYLHENNFLEPNIREVTKNSRRVDFFRRDVDFIKHLYDNSSYFLPRKKEVYLKHWHSYRKRKEAADKEPLR